MAKENKTKTIHRARQAILARTAAGRAVIDKLAAGADMRGVKHLPSMELQSAPPRGRVDIRDPVVDRPPMAPPVIFEIYVRERTREAMRRAAKRSGIPMEEFSDLAVRCILDAAEADIRRVRITATANSNELRA